MNADDAFKLLSYSGFCSLFQPAIMLMHFVLTVFVKILEAKICFYPNFKKEKALECYDD